jgi:uncharacterized coiled-coil protein SlyX
MNLYGKVSDIYAAILHQIKNSSKSEDYVQGMRDCYFLFRKFFYDSGIQNQHALQHELKVKELKIQDLMYRIGELEYDLKSQKDTFAKVNGVSKQQMAVHIRSLQETIEKLRNKLDGSR